MNTSLSSEHLCRRDYVSIKNDSVLPQEFIDFRDECCSCAVTQCDSNGVSKGKDALLFIHPTLSCRNQFSLL